MREGILAGEQVLAGVGDDDTPTLLIQAEEERVVDNRMHDRYCELRAAAGHPCEGVNRWSSTARTMRSF